MIEKFKNWIVPILFGTSVASMILRIYHNADLFKYSCVFLVYAFLCFAIFDLLRKTKKLSGILYLLLFLVVVYLASKNLYVPDAPLSFKNWFYGAQTEETLVPQYSFALIFGGGFFLISILYYFTQVIYRAFGTLLIMFFPLFIYAKRLDEINIRDFVVVLALYLLVLVHNRQMKSDKNCKVIVNKSYFCSVGVFVLIVTFVVSLVPQTKFKALQEQQENYFENMLANTTSAPSNFSDTSNLTGAKLSDEIIFKVTSEYPMFLRRQAYDYFENNAWHLADDEFANLIPNDNIRYCENTSNNGYVKLLLLLSETDNFDGKFEYHYPDDNFPLKTTALIDFTSAFNPMYVPLPLNTVELVFSDYKKTYHGEFKPLWNSNYINHHVVEFSYYPVNYNQQKFLESLNFTSEEILSALNYYRKYVFYDNEEITSAIKDVYCETQYVADSFIDCNGLSEKGIDLAYKITNSLKNPYEKAKALEQFFTEDNFEYKLNVYPDSVDEFLFDKKSGACGDFATAMTLMARAVGLHARYVEGYVVTEKSSENNNEYIVREYHSHAYVEVYINGYGWVVFDPTVDGYLDFYKTGKQTNHFGFLSKIKTPALVCLVTIFVLYVFRKLLFEMLFLIKLELSSDEQTVFLCYNRMVVRLSDKLAQKLLSKTSTEIDDILIKKGIDKKEFINLFEKTCYGGYNPTTNDVKFAKAEYKSAKKTIRKLKINY